MNSNSKPERMAEIKMEKLINDFIEYLHNEKNTSGNTEVSYQRDLKKMAAYFEKQGIFHADEVTESDLKAYISEMQSAAFASSTISRNIASIRALFHYLFKKGVVSEDPSENIRAPRIEKKMPEILTVQEVDRLLSQPNPHTGKGIRDKAMMELLYATGMRVSELLALKTEDVNLSFGYVICHDNGKERVIPIGNVSRDMLQKYMDEARDFFVKNQREPALFTNCSGKPMSRQGFWKIIKYYGEKAGIQADITPHTLRHSFAAHLIRGGADIHAVQAMLGHSDSTTAQMYAAYSGNTVRENYRAALPRK